MQLPAKLWFRLQKLKIELRQALGFGQRGGSIETGLRMCPSCRGLIDRGSSVCPLCGASVRSPARRRGTTPDRVLGVIPVPSTATSVLVAVNIALYGVSWYLTQRAGPVEGGGAMGLGGIRGDVLFRLGAKYGPAIIYGGQWWRLVTAMFLHAGLLHIGLNLWCLFDIGPIAESLFSGAKFIVIYLVTGVFGFLLSLWWSPGALSVGASGAILGLIGLLIGASFHQGSLGREFRGSLVRWVIYIFVFGLFFAVDNAAHIGGLASGFLLGYFVPAGEPQTRSSENIWSALAVLSVLLIAGSFALMSLQLGQPLR
jgi:membrane associated rhomboid family serine protease